MRATAKGISLLGQIIGALWTIGFGSFYILKNINTLDPYIIIWFGFAIVGNFSPVYVNLFTDKFKRQEVKEVKEMTEVGNE